MRVVSQKNDSKSNNYVNIPFESTGFIVNRDDDGDYRILAYVYSENAPYYMGEYKKERHAIFVVEAFEAFNSIGTGIVYLPPEEVLLDSFNAVGKGIIEGTVTQEELNEGVKRLFTTNYWLGGKDIV